MNNRVVRRRTGAVFPLPGRDDARVPTWPTPLTATELADPSRARLGSRAGDYVGEDSLRFAGPARLVVGTLLFLLERQRVVGLAGDLAR